MAILRALFRSEPQVQRTQRANQKGQVMSSNIVLSAGVRTNLLQLQRTADLISITQTRLATGKRVNTALDNPTNFFTAAALNSRASDLNNLLDSMGTAIKTLEAADNGISSITKLVESAQSLARQALQTTDPTERSSLGTQFDDLRTQIDQLAADAGFNGKNLLDGDNLAVVFNEGGTSSLTITGVTFDSAGLAIDGAVANWAGDADIDAALTDLTAGLTKLRSQSKTFGSNLSTVQTRQDFTKSMINTLRTGADNLTLADPNEEGANLLALQTRQQLSTTALSLAAQADQNVLRLFG
ncbi:MAG: flagellin [Xanthobacteraceae bacterium]